MNAQQLLADLERLGVTYSVEGQHLRLEAPRGAISDEMRQSLKEHKPQIVELLSQRQLAPGTGRSGEVPKAGRVEEMTLEAFAEAGLILQVRSEVLGSSVLFVSDDVPEAALAGSDLPVYRAAELRKLALLSPAPHSLRGLHDAKTIFEGTITDVQDRNK